ncbi:MAG: transcription-repair coupling factor [Clostridia bacterium]|nr:transcription-repair coupling factor [Clostridia bacterium]
MSCYSNLFSTSSEYQSIKINTEKGRYPIGVLGLPPTPKAFLIHTLCEDYPHGAVVLVPDEATGEKLYTDLSVLGSKCVTYPARDFNFHSVETGSHEYEQKRIGALSKMISGECNILILSVEAAMQRTLPKKELIERTFTLEPSQEISTEEIREKLVKCGYSACEMVEGAGQFSLRGGILDIFPCNLDNPIRIEFWGDEIDTISQFDIISQRRTETVDKISLAPVTEILFDDTEILADKLSLLKKGLRTKNADKVKEFLSRDEELSRNRILPGCCDKYLPLAYEKAETPLDYFPEKLLFVCETSGVKERGTSQEKLSNEEIKELFSDGVLCKGLDGYYSPFSEITDRYLTSKTVYIDNFARGSFDTPVKDLITYHINQISAWDGSYKLLLEDISYPVKNKYTVLVFAGTEKAGEGLLEELADDEFPALLCKKTPEVIQKGYINILPGALNAGIDFPGEKLLVVSYGRHAKAARKSVKKYQKNKNSFNSLEELHVGDYVVHATNGIGIFDGIHKVQMEGVTKDYIKIKYAKGDILYVPVTKLELVTKYVGPHEEDSSRTVKINRLGAGDWEKTKSRVRGAVKDIAADLIKLYAQRQNTPGYSFSPDIDMQNDFERRFEFEETDDQLRSVDEIKYDMEKSCPMDRLLCGDVGFGKTEVALRAAFKCICDGKQVAFLVPTTILALQHYRTILHRFEGFPIEAEMLCRFRSPKQQKEIIKKLKAGAVDIVAGTHRIISKDVEFKDLGLLIVDEEQRFGVLQKEKLKEKFPTVDVLTLSATPIPRTLNLALSGIRDLSVIEEAPMDRYPVQTYVIEHDMGIISQAIAKELRRGGQVYYLHNNISDITDTAASLKEFFPDAEIAVAHGKMQEDELSDVWKRLTEGDIDILVCTTIIETGVDIPNANTLIIENADRMGLSQLHQLRGRVGRSTRRASAYCTFTRDKQLSEIAERRLSAIREFTQFGSGFKIAMRDLEIRGAGNLLGAKQHGHLESVGYDMYMQLLSEAIEILKNGEENYVPKITCQVDIQIDAFIPDNFISSYPQRIAIYKRIADIHTQDDASDVLDELIDRYGEPPECVLGLIKVSLLRNWAADSGIYEISQKGNSLLLYVNQIDKEILSKLSVMKGRVMANASTRPYYSVRLKDIHSPIATLEEIISALSTKNNTAE